MVTSLTEIGLADQQHAGPVVHKHDGLAVRQLVLVRVSQTATSLTQIGLAVQQQAGLVAARPSPAQAQAHHTAAAIHSCSHITKRWKAS